MDIDKIALRIASGPYPINQDADFWSSVYLSSFQGNRWKEEPMDKNRFRYLVSQFISKLENIIRTANDRRFFYSSIQWKLKGTAVSAIVKMEEKGKKENINLFLGSEGNDAGKVYVDGSYQMGRGKSMKEVAGEIIRVFEQIN